MKILSTIALLLLSVISVAQNLVRDRGRGGGPLFSEVSNQGYFV